jgi:hypothetical protein
MNDKYSASKELRTRLLGVHFKRQKRRLGVAVPGLCVRGTCCNPVFGGSAVCDACAAASQAIDAMWAGARQQAGNKERR